MITSKLGLLDANILVYAVNEDSQFHDTAVKLRNKGLMGEIPLCVTPQVLSEFFAIITDPRRIELPLTQAEAALEVENYFFSKSIIKVYPQPNVIQFMLDFLKRYSVTRQGIFDLQLVATMLANNITRIYTYNEKDFLQYAEIEAIRPELIMTFEK